LNVTICGVDTSGRRLAGAVGDWLASVLPHVAVDFVSLGTAAESDALLHPSGGVDGAILCVTPSSLAEECLAFALGLLHGRVGLSGFVAPLLLDLLPEDVAHTPLAVFQVTTLARSEMAALVVDINARSAVGADVPAFQEAFDESWEGFYQRTRTIPGPAATEFLLTLALSSRILTFPFNPSGEDAFWEESVGSLLEGLPSGPFGVPPFDPGDLAALDVEARRWIEMPVLLSRVPTSHIALVDPILEGQWHGDPRLGARQIGDSLRAKGPHVTFLRKTGML
jgi:hypothetical protein